MLNIEHLYFSYGKKEVLTDLSLTLQNGELLSLMGPSGCGKSTLMQLIAGLLKSASGTLKSDFKKVSYVFQEPRLFPWLSVKENLCAVLPEYGKGMDAEISEMLAKLGLKDTESLFPDELSGGMKIRVSLARALLYHPDLLLLDEPFASLDEVLRKELMQVLKSELGKNHCATVFVTHLKEDAEAFSDRIFHFPI